MKNLTALGLLLGWFRAADHTICAQIAMPDVSPFATVTQNINFSEVRIDYSHPGVRGKAQVIRLAGH